MIQGVERHDNLRVAIVMVMVLDEQGTVLEQGEATQQDSPSSGSGLWWYVSQRAGKTIIAKAYDLAGNVTQSAI